MSKVEAFQFSNSTGRTPFYHYIRRGERGWYAVSQSGIPEAMSNFAENATLMEIQMDRCASAEMALEVFKSFARRQYAETAQVV